MGKKLQKRRKRSGVTFLVARDKERLAMVHHSTLDKVPGKEKCCMTIEEGALLRVKSWPA